MRRCCLVVRLFFLGLAGLSIPVGRELFCLTLVGRLVSDDLGHNLEFGVLAFEMPHSGRVNANADKF